MSLEAKPSDNPVRRVRRPLRTVLVGALVGVLTLVAAGCNSGTAWIAKVNGETVAAPHFWEGVPFFATYSAAAQQSAPPTTVVPGVADSTSASSYAFFLTQIHALKLLNARHHTTVGAAELAQMRKSYESSGAATQFKEFPGWFVDQLIAAQANYQALTAYYAKGVDSDALVKAYYEANKDQFEQLCLEVIGATSEAPLTEARKSITDGADFGTVAKQVAAKEPAGSAAATAMGTKADGDVGCVATSQLSGLFTDPAALKSVTGAAQGSLVGPLAVSQGLYMLFRVGQHKVQPLAEAKSSIEQVIGQPGQKEAQKALTDFLNVADISFNPRVGRLVKGQGPVPPTGAERPASATTLPLGLSGAAG